MIGEFRPLGAEGRLIGSSLAFEGIEGSSPKIKKPSLPKSKDRKRSDFSFQLFSVRPRAICFMRTTG